MSVSDVDFRAVMGRFPTGVTVVTTCDGARPAGLTVNAFASISLDPLLVMVSIDKRSHLHDIVAQTGFFAVNILGAHQQETSRRFAGQTNDRNDRFRETPYHAGSTGAPILDEAIAWVECRVHAKHHAGDHTIFLGEVVSLNAVEGAPLVYYRTRYGDFVAEADTGAVPGRRE